MYPRIFREIILTFARNNSFQVSARLFDRFIENHNRRLRRNPRKKLDEFVKYRNREEEELSVNRILPREFSRIFYENNEFYKI